MQTQSGSGNQTVLFVLLFLACIGCSRDATDGPAVFVQAESPEIADSDTVFRFPSLEIFRNNIQLGPDDGCITTFTVDEASRQSMTATCGTSEATATTVSWKCVSHSRNEAVFLFRINSGRTEPAVALESTTVIFTGEDIIVFENESSRTTLRLAGDPR